MCKNYYIFKVHGIIRRSSSFNLGRIHHLFDDPKSHRHERKLPKYVNSTNLFVKQISLL